MYNLIKYSDYYSKKSERFWQCCIDKLAVNHNGVIVDSNAAKVTDLFNFTEKITGQTDDNETKHFKIVVRLKEWSNF